MAFINEPSIVKLVVSGGSVNFPFGFKWFNTTDITVFYVPPNVTPDDTLNKVSSSDYVLTSNASKVGGNIQMTLPIVDGGSVTVQRSLPITRTIDYAKRGSFTAVVMNDDQDYQSYLQLDADSRADTFVATPVSGSGGFSLPSQGANEEYIRWDANGNLVNDTTPPIWRDETEVFRDEAEIFAYGDPVHSGTTTKGAEQYAEDAETDADRSEFYANVSQGLASKTSARNTVISSPNGVLVINGAGVDVLAGSVISYAEGTDGTSGDLDSIETTTLHSNVSLIPNVTNYLYMDKGNNVGSTQYPLIKGVGLLPDTNSDIYLVDEGLVANPSGTFLSRVYLGQVGVDGGGTVITSTLVSYAVAHLDVAELEVYGDTVLHGGLYLEQTWQDVTISRANNVTYTNTTGKPIEIAISIASGGTSTYTIQVDGVEVGRVANNITGTINATISATIPSNSTYIVSGGFNVWSELRGV